MLLIRLVDKISTKTVIPHPLDQTISTVGSGIIFTIIVILPSYNNGFFELCDAFYGFRTVRVVIDERDLESGSFNV